MSHIQSHERLLKFNVVQLHSRIFVEGGVMGGEPVGGLETSARLLGIALLEGAVSRGQQSLGLFRAFALLVAPIGEGCGDEDDEEGEAVEEDALHPQWDATPDEESRHVRRMKPRSK